MTLVPLQTRSCEIMTMHLDSAGRRLIASFFLPTVVDNAGYNVKELLLNPALAVATMVRKAELLRQIENTGLPTRQGLMNLEMGAGYERRRTASSDLSCA